MESKEALRYIIDRSGKPKTKISLELGKTSGYINAYLSIGRTPGMDVLSSIADVLGYDLLLVNRETGETIPIDPNGQDESKTD